MNLDSPVLMIPGVGVSSAKALQTHAIATVEDVLTYTPYRYIDFTHPRLIRSLRLGEQVTVQGEVISIKIERTSRRQMMLVRATLKDQSGEVDVVWFNQAYLATSIKPGTRLYLHGTVGAEKGKRVLKSPLMLRDHHPRPVAVYSERTGVESGRFARMVTQTLALSSQIPDPLTDDLRTKFNLLSRARAIVLAHHPESIEDVERARERLALDELWSIMTIMRLDKSATDEHQSPSMVIPTAYLEKEIRGLPYTLTVSQSQALEQILVDLGKSIPMRRLLNGDVGSGKTIIAFLAAIAVMRSGLKVVFLAPTALLAEQHDATFCKLFPQYQHFLITANKVTHRGQKSSRKEVMSALQSTNAALICGTHAVFHRDLGLKRGVGLVIVDEQHRFGVMQRAHFATGSTKTIPHLLSMSATPIPRTAALVLYGDLDISVLTEKPTGRIPVVTKLASEKSRAAVYQFIDQLIAKGQQVFVVCPIIGTDDTGGAASLGQLFALDERKAVTDEYDRLKSSVFSHRRIGLLHGRLRQTEKDDVMAAFRDSRLDILVCTSMVEVGVDIPRASVMLVESAEFFGLAQLHQLRGRVGRSDMQSYCFLFASHWSDSVKHRLDLMALHADGFTLSEKDLELRGPGELYGTMQAGLAPFKYAQLSNQHLVIQAQSITNDLLAMPQSSWSDALRQWIAGRQSTIHRE